MTTKAILEKLTRGGYSASILYHSDGWVAVRAAHVSGYTVRATGRTELEAAVGVWNRLGFQPALRFVGSSPEKAVAVEPAGSSRPQRRSSGLIWLQEPLRILLRG